MSSSWSVTLIAMCMFFILGSYLCSRLTVFSVGTLLMSGLEYFLCDMIAFWEIGLTDSRFGDFIVV